jgi:competence protein ComEC
MRKLAIAAAAFSAAAFAANYILPQGWLIYAAVVAVALSAALAMLGRKWLRPAVLALIFFGLGLFRFELYYRQTVAKAETYNGESYNVSAELLDYPQINDSYCRLEVKLTGDNLPKLKALVYDSSMSSIDLKPGAVIELTGTVKTADTLYGDSYDGYYSKGIFLKITAKGQIVQTGQQSVYKHLAAYISHELSSRIGELFPDDVSAFMQALMLGNKDSLYDDEALTLAMSRAGFMHVVAVSGLHVIFLVSLVQLALGNGRKSAIIGIAFIWAFVLISGASPSAVRAGFMQSLLLMAPVLRRENDPITSLSTVMALILLKNPYAAASVSLQLSFGAIAGIMCVSVKSQEFICTKLKKLSSYSLFRYAFANFSSSIGAMIFTLPLIAIHFGYISLASIITNVLALWAASLCFCGGWIACAVGSIPVISDIAVSICTWLARYIFLVVKLIAALKYAVLYTEINGLFYWLIGAYAVFILCFIAIRNKWLRIVLPSLVSILSLIIFISYVNYNYTEVDTFAVVDVGQGLCTVAMSEDSTVIVDCGNVNSIENAGELAGRYLLSRGRGTVDAVILTHLHEDHANGLTMLMEMVDIKKLLIPETAEDTELLWTIEAKAQQKGIAVEYVKTDMMLSIGKIEAQLLLPEWNQDVNERCMAVRLTLSGRSAMITGDSSMAVERQLARSYELDDTEILVVGHHGSQYSTSEMFLNELRGNTAIISVGYNNFGHPADETLERLAFCGYNVYRTDEDGTVEIRLG